MISSHWDGSESTRGCSHLRPGMDVSLGGASSALVLHGRTYRDLTASGEHISMCLSLSLEHRKSKKSTGSPNTIFLISSYPTAFGGFQAFLEEVPSPAAIITRASLKMYNLSSSPSTLNAAGLQKILDGRISSSHLIRSSSSHSHSGEDNSCAQLEPTPATPEPTFSKGLLCPTAWPAAEWPWGFQHFHK